MHSELGLLTYNIRYGTARDGRHAWALRRPALADLVGAIPWDVCGLQEVLPSQRDYLDRRQPGMRWYGVGRVDGDGSGEQAALVVRGGVWTVLDWETHWLSEKPDQIGSVGWDAHLPRVATVARLVGADSRRPVAVVNTHFDHAGDLARLESARLVASWVAAEPATAWVVLGDLNCAPGSPPVRELEAAGLRQVLPGDAGGTEHAWTGRTDGDRIDHILVDDSFEVLDAAVDHTRPGRRTPQRPLAGPGPGPAARGGPMSSAGSGRVVVVGGGVAGLAAAYVLGERPRGPAARGIAARRRQAADRTRSPG